MFWLLPTHFPTPSLGKKTPNILNFFARRHKDTYWPLQTDLQVDDGAKLAKMFIKFTDVVEFRGNLPH